MDTINITAPMEYYAPVPESEERIIRTTADNAQGIAEVMGSPYADYPDFAGWVPQLIRGAEVAPGRFQDITCYFPSWTGPGSTDTISSV